MKESSFALQSSAELVGLRLLVGASREEAESWSKRAIDMGIMVRERAHESALMEQRRGDESFCSEQLLAEPQLPSGWEKCLDLKV